MGDRDYAERTLADAGLSVPTPEPETTPESDDPFEAAAARIEARAAEMDDLYAKIEARLAGGDGHNA